MQDPALNAARCANSRPPNVVEPNDLPSLTPPLILDNSRTTLICHGFVCTRIETFCEPCRANLAHLLARSRPWKLFLCRPPTRTEPLALVQRPFPSPSQEARVLR